jgi:hypothetical protein
MPLAHDVCYYVGMMLTMIHKLLHTCMVLIQQLYIQCKRLMYFVTFFNMANIIIYKKEKNDTPNRVQRLMYKYN